MSGRYVELLGDRLGEGDSCFVQAEGDPLSKKPFIASIKKLEEDPGHGGYLCTVNWYYRPEDPGIPGGRKVFHGERELYESDHCDIIHSKTILGRCNVHTLDEYRELDIVRPQDYYARFKFSIASKRVWPNSVTVYCVCMMPENPDQQMVQCDACHEWFHPECCRTTLAEVEVMPEWRCPTCEQKPARAGDMGIMPGIPDINPRWINNKPRNAAGAGAAGPAAAAPAAAATLPVTSAAAAAALPATTAAAAVAAALAPAALAPAALAAAARAVAPAAPVAASRPAPAPLAIGGGSEQTAGLLSGLLGSGLGEDPLLEMLQAQHRTGGLWGNGNSSLADPSLPSGTDPLLELLQVQLAQHATQQQQHQQQQSFGGGAWQ